MSKQKPRDIVSVCDWWSTPCWSKISLDLEQVLRKGNTYCHCTVWTHPCFPVCPFWNTQCYRYCHWRGRGRENIFFLFPFLDPTEQNKANRGNINVNDNVLLREIIANSWYISFSSLKIFVCTLKISYIAPHALWKHTFKWLLTLPPSMEFPSTVSHLGLCQTKNNIFP